MSDLNNATVIVTGASRGIGKGIAIELGRAGATVYVTGRTLTSGDLPGSVEETATAITEAGGQGMSVQCDHAEDDQIAALFDRVKQERGALDVLVNNAYPTSALFDSLGQRFWEHDMDAWDQILGVGTRSHIVAGRLAIPMMLGNEGLIVNVSSIGAKRFTPYGSAYGVGKAAIDKFTADAAVELEGTGITMVSLWPGVTQTEMLEHLQATGHPHFDTLMQGVSAPTPPALVGEAVVHLARDPEVERFSDAHIPVIKLAEEYASQREGS